MKNIGLYLIISKPQLTYEEIAEVCVEEEVAFLQFREKELCDREILQHSKKLKKILNGSKTQLVVNDRPDIALLAQADVLHLGQDDIPVTDARRIVGNMPIGISTHNLKQLSEALQLKPIYVGFGPVFPTTTKKNPDPVVGIDLLKQALHIATVPVVAIGGIFPENIDQVLLAGVRNICMVRYFMDSKSKKELQEKIRFINQKIKAYDTSTTSH